MCSASGRLFLLVAAALVALASADATLGARSDEAEFTELAEQVRDVGFMSQWIQKAIAAEVGSKVGKPIGKAVSWLVSVPVIRTFLMHEVGGKNGFLSVAAGKRCSARKETSKSKLSVLSWNIGIIDSIHKYSLEAATAKYAGLVRKGLETIIPTEWLRKRMLKRVRRWANGARDKRDALKAEALAEVRRLVGQALAYVDSHEDVDVIMFQEAWQAHFGLLDKLLKEDGRFCNVVGDRRFMMGSGLVIASRFPLTHMQFASFRETCHFKNAKITGFSHTKAVEDCFADKGALFVTVESPNGPWHVVTTHLQSGSTPRKEAIKRHQFKVIKQLVEEQKVGDDEPTLIGGDFNVNYWDKDVTGKPSELWRQGVSDDMGARPEMAFSFVDRIREELSRDDALHKNQLDGIVVWKKSKGVKNTHCVVPPELTPKVKSTVHPPIACVFEKEEEGEQQQEQYVKQQKKN